MTDIRAVSRAACGASDIDSTSMTMTYASSAAAIPSRPRPHSDEIYGIAPNGLAHVSADDGGDSFEPYYTWA